MWILLLIMNFANGTVVMTSTTYNTKQYCQEQLSAVYKLNDNNQKIRVLGVCTEEKK